MWSHCVAFMFLIAGIECSSKVKLRDISTLTFMQGEYTTSRRSPKVPQLKCIGGSADSVYQPKAVQCYNRGYDGIDVQWECRASMNANFKFGKIYVTCEGYDYPEDSYVLKGSCGLEYELEFTESDTQHDSKRTTFPSHQYKDVINVRSLATFGMIILCIYLLYTKFLCQTEGNEYDRRRGGSGRDDWPPPGPDPRRPPPPGFKFDGTARQPPPTYEDSCRGASGSSFFDSTAGPFRRNQSRSAGSNDGLGFWTGMGLGSLAGYMFGSSTNSSGYRDRTGQFEHNTGVFTDSFPSTSHTHEEPERTTCDFATTKRR